MPTPRRRRAVRRGAAVVVATGLALALAGCVGAPAPTPTPTSAGTPEPIFASDEEALAAAEAAYATYLAAVDELTQAGGEGGERIQEVVSPDYAGELIESLERLQESGRRTAGSTTFDRMRVLERSETDGMASVSAYLCLNVSQVRVLDSVGADVTPGDRDDRTPLIAHFTSSTEESAVLLPSGSESWTGDDFC